MTGPEHRDEAERLLLECGQPDGSPERGQMLLEAVVHVGLAQVAATLDASTLPPGTQNMQRWRR